jgi:hypothetical protein
MGTRQITNNRNDQIGQYSKFDCDSRSCALRRRIPDTGRVVIISHDPCHHASITTMLATTKRRPIFQQPKTHQADKHDIQRFMPKHLKPLTHPLIYQNTPHN